MGRRTRLAVALATLLVAAPFAPAGNVSADAPVRILIVGDSVTQGSSGDYTWRYRMWQALTSDGVAFDLVGPRKDLLDLVAGGLGSSAYADDVDPAFDTDHAARWGMSLAFPDVPLADLVRDYQPDVVVEMRGINDLTWFHGSSAGLAELVEEEIAAARSVDPGLDFVVGELPQVWLGDAECVRTPCGDPASQTTSVRAYNDDRLPELAMRLGTDQSRVAVAHAARSFVGDVDTWDPAHPSATGEVKIGAAVVDALAALGVGAPYPRPLPTVDNGHWPAATGLVAHAGIREVRLDWNPPVGVAEQYVWWRDTTLDGPWTRLAMSVTGPSWTVGGLREDHAYDFRVQSAKGTAISSRYSASASATPRAAEVLPPARVAGVALTPGPGRLAVNWSPVPGATSYDLSWLGTDGRAGAISVSGTETLLTNLTPGTTYAVTIVARNRGGAAAPVTVSGTAGSPAELLVPSPVAPTPPAPATPVPATPTGLQVVRGPHRLEVRWDRGPVGTTYDVALVGRTTGYQGRRVVEATSVSFAGLLAGEQYTLLVTPLNAAGPGPLAQVVGVPTGPVPAPPGAVRARSSRPGRVVAAWRPQRHATSYEVAVRASGHWVTVRTTTAPRAAFALESGRVRLRVRAWHQRLPGGWSVPVRLRVG